MSDFNEKIMTEFRANGGKVAQFGDAPMIILGTIGAKSGDLKEIPLVYLPDGERMIVFASKAGATTNPDWAYNLRANPSIEVEVGTAKFAATVAEVTGTERDDLYAKQAGLMPQFAEYEEKAGDRVIPVFAVNRV
ncbi:MAG: deazaflavin-dependent oxidoreductase (nitroreductase family) [Acidimicrobiales bacterium]|jgi:deazaflavin-dependent oxidoreductase (nitroreductase family)